MALELVEVLLRVLDGEIMVLIPVLRVTGAEVLDVLLMLDTSGIDEEPLLVPELDDKEMAEVLLVLRYTESEK